MLISRSALIFVLAWTFTSGNVTYRKNERAYKQMSKRKVKKPPPRPLTGQSGGHSHATRKPVQSSSSSSSYTQSHEAMYVPGYQAATTWATYPPDEESPVQAADPYPYPGQETSTYSGQVSNPSSGQVSNQYPDWAPNQNSAQENSYSVPLPNSYTGQGQMLNSAPAGYPTERRPVAPRYPVADRYQSAYISPVASSGSVTYPVLTPVVVTNPIYQGYGSSYGASNPVRYPVLSPTRYSAAFPVQSVQYPMRYPVAYPVAAYPDGVTLPGSTNTYQAPTSDAFTNTYPVTNSFPALYPGVTNINPAAGSSNIGMFGHGNGSKKKRRYSVNKKTTSTNIFQGGVETFSVTPPKPPRKTKKPIEFRQRITRTPVHYQYSNVLQPSTSDQSQVQDQSSYQYPQVQGSTSYQYPSPVQVYYVRPTPYPTRQPTPYPTRHPTPYPTRQPTPYPTRHPTPYPTLPPTPIPTPVPTLPPTPNPTKPPTKPPTLAISSNYGFLPGQILEPVGVPVQEPIVTFPAIQSSDTFSPPQTLNPVSVSVTQPVSSSVTDTAAPTVEEENWITTDLATYAPGDPVYVAWHRAEPQIGDIIKFTVYDADIGEYRTVFTHSICVEQGCLSSSIDGELEAQPSPPLEPEFYYVSLYDNDDNELSYIDIVVE